MLVYSVRVIRLLPPGPPRSSACDLLKASHQFSTEMIKASAPRPYKTGDFLVVLGLLSLESFLYASAAKELRCR